MLREGGKSEYGSNTEGTSGNFKSESIHPFDQGECRMTIISLDDDEDALREWQKGSLIG